MANKKAVVALAKEPSVQESVTRVFDLMGGVTNMIEKGSVVFLKPNAGHAAPADTSVCTNPEVVRAVIREVKKASPRQIVIAEAAAIGCDTMECYEVSGIKAVADEEGVELYDIKSDKDLVNVAVRGYRSNLSHVKLPRRILEADHLINLPILKAHASMVFSCALKNIKGVVQDAVHLQMHQQNLTMAMMDVWDVCRADINIVDAVRPASGYSPHTPVPIEVGCVLGSYDPVAVDLIACDLVGIDAEAVDYFRVAAETGLGTTERENIEVVGEKIEDCYKKMWVPYIGDMSTRWPEYKVLCQGACSSCQALLAINMETLKAIGDYERRSDFTVVAGPKNVIPDDVKDEKLVLHGNCTRKYLKDHPNAIHIEGCPPSEPLLYMSLSNGELVHGKDGQMSEYIRPRMAADQPVWRKYVVEQAEKFYGAQEQ
ncbi:MAG: DUF362 domain-containing protein [Clostridia bacterium]|nr:DUF362 domain-containing protein [Clostridia bacterium]